MKEQTKKKREPEIIIQYEPDPNFNEEFAEFVGEVFDLGESKRKDGKKNGRKRK